MKIDQWTNKLVVVSKSEGLDSNEATGMKTIVDVKSIYR